jgi:hypothetical protein
VIAAPPEPARRVLAHERLRVVERAREHVDVVRRADFPEHHGGVAFHRRQLGALYRRAAERGTIGVDVRCHRLARGRASLSASASRGRNGESCGSSRANLTFQAQTDWDVYRYTHFAVPLGTGVRTLAKEPRK